MKIVVTGTRGIPDIPGGVETHCEELFPRLVARGADVTVIRRRSYVSGGQAEYKGVKLVDINTPKRKSFEAIVHTFRAVGRARRMKADIVHIHAVGPALLTPYAKLLGMRVVFTHHGPDYDRDKWGRVAKAALRLGERLGCMFADDVIVISDVIRRSIAKKYNRRRRVHLVYNGVPGPDITHFPEYFSSLGIDEGGYILGMCRFVPEKNLHHLVEAYKRLGERGLIDKEIKLVLAGDTEFEDDYSRELKRTARTEGVVLTGFVKGRKLHSLLTNARVYCLPSSHEGLPIALLEAMSYGLPVVVSDIPANLEIGLPAGSYFPTGDVNALAERLADRLKSPPGHVSYDLTPYDWDAIAEQMTKIYL
ncbi:MAG: glycosyltransferase family 4 protein [Prevotella sp.]|nr:glycosyltransferase family 4 protein [Prevotella sp.]